MAVEKRGGESGEGEGRGSGKRRRKGETKGKKLSKTAENLGWVERGGGYREGRGLEGDEVGRSEREGAVGKVGAPRNQKIVSEERVESHNTGTWR